MKKTLAILTTCVLAVSAFAQGKVTFGNDGNHLIVFVNDPSRLTSASGQNFASLAGLALPQLGTAQNTLNLFTAQLFAGTSAGAVSTLVATQAPTGIAGNPDGRLANQTVTLPAGFPATTPTFFQIRIWETSAGNYANALATHVSGQTAVFSASPGSFAYSFLTTSTDWSGPITMSGPIPEPSTFVLAGLGLVSLLLFRRRK
jgi:hypothetical protein